MADTYYAWGPIRTSGDEEGSVKVIAAGEKVTPASVGFKDENDHRWIQLVEGGAVRKAKYPDIPAEWTGSVVDFLIAKAEEEGAEMILLGSAGSTFSPPPEEVLLGPGVEKAEGKRPGT